MPPSSSGRASFRDDHYAFHTELHRQHEESAKVWDKNLRSQGFAEAFERQQQRA